MVDRTRVCGKCNTRVPLDSPHMVKRSADGDLTEYHWDCGERAYAQTLGEEEGATWLSKRRYLSTKQPVLWKG